MQIHRVKPEQRQIQRERGGHQPILRRPREPNARPDAAIAVAHADQDAADQRAADDVGQTKELRQPFPLHRAQPQVTEPRRSDRHAQERGDSQPPALEAHHDFERDFRQKQRR